MRYAGRIIWPDGGFAWLTPGPHWLSFNYRGEHVVPCSEYPFAMSKKVCLEIKSVLRLDEGVKIEIMRYPAARVIHRLCRAVPNSGAKIDKEKKDTQEILYGLLGMPVP